MKVLSLAPLALSACAVSPAYVAPPPYGDPPPATPSDYPAQDDPCRSIVGSDFAAWVNAMPGPNARPKLIVIGKVTTPTGGYRIRFGELIVMESYPVQIVADLVVTPPDGPATQAVMTHDVRGDWPSEERVGAVTVRCGARTIAQISPVETAR